MRTIHGFTVAAATGALATYFLDAQHGRRRRAVFKDRVVSRLKSVDDAGRVVAVDVRNRAQGAMANLWHGVSRADVSDDVLVERVHSRLGHVVSHLGSIEVLAHQGVVTLRGPVLKRELKPAMQAVWAVRGVQGVENQFEVHEQSGDVPALQGGRARRRRRDIMQENWSPATRALVGSGGVALVACGLMRRTPAALLLAAGGAALLVRAATNMDTRRLLGQRGRKGFDFTKTITIDAPVDDVFAFWSNFENFPNFMHNVRDVRKNKENSWHWEVAGPLGTTMQWDATVTQSIPNELITWSTTPGSPVQHAGTVRFQSEGDGTRLQVQMTYSPPAGAAGHVAASLFGADPATEMDQDLMRLKVYFETGKPARDAAQR